MADHNKPNDDEWVSKTRKKQEMNALQDLGSELLELSADTLKRMELPEDLLAALLEGKRLTAHGAIARHKQYIGKIMRHVDPEPIQQRLDIIRGDSAEHNAWLHLVERWRERLLSDDTMLSTFVSDFPEADIQQLRTLIRTARKEKQESKPPKCYRLLFQAIKELIPEPGKSRQSDQKDDEEDQE
jgi:ribosome-associated protein